MSADADIGRDRDLHAAAQNPALQRGDHRLFDIAHQLRIFDAVAEGHEIRQVDQRIEIAASRESALAGAADRYHANATVNVDGAADALQFPRHFRCHGVHLVDAIDQDLPDTVFNGE